MKNKQQSRLKKLKHQRKFLIVTDSGYADKAKISKFISSGGITINENNIDEIITLSKQIDIDYLNNEVNELIENAKNQIAKSSKNVLTIFFPKTDFPFDYLNKNWGRRIIEKIAESRLCLNNQNRPKSTSMFPVAENPPNWVVGCFGSVFCDIELDGTLLRLYYAGKGKLYGKFSVIVGEPGKTYDNEYLETDNEQNNKIRVKENT